MGFVGPVSGCVGRAGALAVALVRAWRSPGCRWHALIGRVRAVVGPELVGLLCLGGPVGTSRHRGATPSRDTGGAATAATAETSGGPTG